MFFEKTKDFSTFGKSFQEKLAHIIMRDRAFADQIYEVLEVQYFELKYLRKFVKEIYEYKKHYDFYPTDDVFKTVLDTKYPTNMVDPPSLNCQLHDFFKHKITGQNVKKEEEKYVKEKSLDFCRKQVFLKSVERAMPLLDTSSFDIIKKLMDETFKLGSDNDFGYDYKLDFNARYVENHRHPIPTPSKHLNKIMGGGHGKGELGVIIAPTGVGKSMWAVALGAHALKLGFNVVYYTLELLDTVIGQRFDSCISGIDLDDLRDSKDEIFNIVKDLPGKLIVKEYPAKRASISTIERHLERLVTSGFEPDMVIVDYGDLLKPEGYDDLRISLGSIYEELRGLAKQFNVAMWSPTQSNRKGLNSPIVTMEEISEAFNKCFTADFIMSLSRTIKDKNNNTAKIFVAKNRNGDDGAIFPVRMRTANVYFDVLERVYDSIDEILERAERDSVENLQKRYEGFKNGIQ